MELKSVAKLAVAVETYHIDRPYDYIIPPEFSDVIAPGIRVSVPFGRGNRRTEGIVLSGTKASEAAGGKELKTIFAALDAEPVLSQEQIKLALWMSERFYCTVYDAVKAMLPAGMWFKDGVRRTNDKSVTMAALIIPAEEALILAAQKKRRAKQQAYLLELLSQIGGASVKELCHYTGATRTSINALAEAGAIELYEQKIYRRPAVKAASVSGPIVLNNEQQPVFESLLELLQRREAGAALLYGVTGSGKTSVYIRLIEETIKMGRDAVVLVPEIALTPQLISTFAAYFGDSIAVLHSSLAIGERYDEWKRIRSGSVRVVVGTRSAVFAPVRDLGLLIIDEEQEHTYKSENSPRYHARDVAKYCCVATARFCCWARQHRQLRACTARWKGGTGSFGWKTAIIIWSCPPSCSPI